MSPDHDVLFLFREANPVSDLDLLDAASETATDFLTTAKTRESQVDKSPRRVGWRARASLAAVVAALAVLAVFMWNTPGEDAPVGTAPPTTVSAPEDFEVATDWVTCVLGDCDRGAGVVSSTSINGEPAPQYQTFRVRLGSTEIAAACEEEGSVICTVTGTDLVRETFGHTFTETWAIEVVDGAVTSATVDTDDAGTMDAYEAWLEANYPEEMSAVEVNGYEPWLAHAEEFMASDAWVRPYQIDIVGTWQMLKGEIWTFSKDGVYTVADRDGVYETGNYTFEEPNITIQATESTACPTQVGVYEMRFFSADRFGWVLVDDECGIRGSLLNGLAERSE